jgi:DNA-binding ferritin-like protein
MKRTFRKKQKNTTRKLQNNSSKKILQNFENEITTVFFENLLMIKLFHWKTYSYSTHKATDELYGSINENMDKFMEVLLGKSEIRIDLSKKKSISLMDVKTKEDLIVKIESFKSYLVSLTNNKAMKLMTNTDLLNIRDEILGNVNQFLYLLSLK